MFKSLRAYLNQKLTDANLLQQCRSFRKLSKGIQTIAQLCVAEKNRPETRRRNTISHPPISRSEFVDFAVEAAQSSCGDDEMRPAAETLAATALNDEKPAFA